MIRIYGVRLSDLPEQRLLEAFLKPYLGDSWRARHQGTRGMAPLASLGGAFLLQCARLRGELACDGLGRPRLMGSNVDFSITHTDRAVFCAVAEMPVCVGGAFSMQRLFAGEARVGLDAENDSRILGERTAAIAARWFTEAEQRQMAADVEGKAFLRIWTRKEALVKWLGVGMAGLRDADTALAEEQYGVHFFEYRHEDALITLCTHAGESHPERISMLSREEIEEILQKS